MSEFFSESVDLRLRVMMYLMTGLLSYFVFDLSNTYFGGAIETATAGMRDGVSEIEAAEAMMEQAPAILENIGELNAQIDELKKREREWRTRALECNEPLLVNLFSAKGADQTPFYQFQIEPAGRIGDLDHSVYHVDLRGRYDDIVSTLKRLDGSACQRNISRWRLQVRPNTQDTIVGELAIDLFKAVKQP
ncbi:MAG: hypothetical protein GC154_05635 [bacterium]|nr:hypothetical protein [bacterium]